MFFRYVRHLVVFDENKENENNKKNINGIIN